MINFSEFEVVIPTHVFNVLRGGFYSKFISLLIVSFHCTCIRKGFTDDNFESVEYLFRAPSPVAPYLRDYLKSFSKLIYSSASASERSLLSSWSFGEIRDSD